MARSQWQLREVSPFPEQSALAPLLPLVTAGGSPREAPPSGGMCWAHTFLCSSEHSGCWVGQSHSQSWRSAPSQHGLLIRTPLVLRTEWFVEIIQIKCIQAAYETKSCALGQRKKVSREMVGSDCYPNHEHSSPTC